METNNFKGHGLQYSIPTASDMYAPARDFAHNYPVLIQSVIRAFSTDYWPELFDYLVKTRRDLCGMEIDSSGKEITPEQVFDELERAKDIYCQFLNCSCEDPEESVEDLLKRVGWNAVETDIQLAWFAMLGQVMTGQLFAGIRDLTPFGGRGGKIEEVKYFIEEGHKARRALNGLGSVAEAVNIVREAVRAARKSGINFVDIHELVKDVELGRI